MTSRSDIPRLGASCSVLGTLLEDRGQNAWDVMFGWQHGPRKAPSRGEVGGGGGESAAEDRKLEERQRQRAAEMFAEYQADLNLLDAVVQRLMRRVDVAHPPNISEVANRRTEQLDPVTAADAAAAGWCASCWRDDQHLTVIETNKHSLRYFRDYCRWCGGVKSAYGIEPPLSMLKLHHEGRRIAEKDMAAAVQAVLDAMPKKPSSKKAQRRAKRKGQAA